MSSPARPVCPRIVPRLTFYGDGCASQPLPRCLPSLPSPLGGRLLRWDRSEDGSRGGLVGGARHQFRPAMRRPPPAARRRPHPAAACTLAGRAASRPSATRRGALGASPVVDGRGAVPPAANNRRRDRPPYLNSSLGVVRERATGGGGTLPRRLTSGYMAVARPLVADSAAATGRGARRRCPPRPPRPVQPPAAGPTGCIGGVNGLQRESMIGLTGEEGERRGGFPLG